MLKVGDTFQQGELTYKVVGKDAQGRPISTLCADEPVEDGKKEDDPEGKDIPDNGEKEETPAEGQMKQESLVGDAEPAKKRGRK